MSGRDFWHHRTASPQRTGSPTRLLLLALLLLLAACARSEVPTVERLALRIEQEGLYRVTAADLRPFGWDLAALPAEHIRLSRGTALAPFVLVGEGREQFLVFFGLVTPTRYYEHSVYYLELGGQPLPDGRGSDRGSEGASGLAAASVLVERSAAPAGAAVQAVGEDRMRVQPRRHYLAQVREGNPWLGERLFAPGQISITLQVDQPAAGPATLTVRHWSAAQAPVNPDHHLIYRLNQAVIGDRYWDGMGWHAITLQVPDGLLRPGENTLTLEAPGDTEALAEIVYLGEVELSYARALTASGDSLRFSASAPAVRLDGFTRPDIELWDVGDALAPVRLRDFSVTQQEGRHQVTFSAASGGPYVSVTSIAMLSPASIGPAPSPPAIPESGADYVVIAHPSLAAEVQPLLDWRALQGLRVALVTTEQIYTGFSQGLPDPAALPAFLRWAAETWPPPAPRFLLLAGDASYDPLDILGGPYRDLVPTQLLDTQVMGETASDNATADLNGDGLPELAVGRLPAQTPAQMRAMVRKILDYEQALPEGEWRQHSLFVADDDTAFFRRFNQDMAALLPEGFQTGQLVIGEGGDVRAQLLQALNAGQRLVTYMGHGAIGIWAQEEILRSSDIASLDQQGRLPFVVVWACLSGYFHHPQIESLGEALLLAEGRGAVAALVPTGQTYPNYQQLMAQSLYGDHLFRTGTVGEAVLAAFRGLDPASAGQRDIINTFVLLGDPALRLFEDP